MRHTNMLKLLLGLTSATFLIILVLIFFFYCKKLPKKHGHSDLESNNKSRNGGAEGEREDLVIFQGGEDLTICDILDAPGEVIGKSNCGTLYKALLQRNDTVRLLRFLRPVCTARDKEFGDFIELLGCIRHPNLVPLLGFYAGPRGEKLLVHPFYKRGNLAQFIRGGSGEAHKWSIIYRISIGVAGGLDYLHTGSVKPLIHGNLKSKNILLDRTYQPYISDFGFHLLLSPTAGQEMLETSASHGYKAHELIKMKDASEESDIYSFGVIMLELISGKEPINENPTPDEDFYLPNVMRNAVIDHIITDFYHPDLLLSSNNSHENPVTEEPILEFFHLAMACCSHSPSLRPNIKQVLRKLEEIGK